MKRTRIAPVSRKRKIAIPKRTELRLTQLSRQPMCEGLIDGCNNQATDVHELINRSQRSSSWLEPDLFVSLCRPCHRFVTDNPKWAKDHYFTLSAWQYIVSELKDAAWRYRNDRFECKSKTCKVSHLPPAESA